MEYVAGGSLEQFWRGHGGLVPVAAAVRIIRQVCAGLAVAHAEQPALIHRDIKPQNILIGYNANGIRACVSDFGLAKRVNPLTLIASACGTLHFKAPEALQAQGDSRAGDVWAIASTLYLLLIDRLPYSGRSQKNRFDQPLKPPSQINPLVDEALDLILARGLALLPKERYPSAKELLEALETWQPGGAPAPIEPGRPPAMPAAKNALGDRTPPDRGEAPAMAETAVELAKQTGKLAEAIDLLEEALALDPRLREEFDYQLQLWHRDIVM